MHWHAFAWSGHQVPDDSAAADPAQAVMPTELHLWFRKPESLRRGMFPDPDSAYAWLSRELREACDDRERMPGMLAHYREHLALRQDAYAGFYARGSLTVRALLTCPRTGADQRPVICPEPPA